MNTRATAPCGSKPFQAKYDGVGTFGKEQWDKLLGNCSVSPFAARKDAPKFSYLDTSESSVCDLPAVALGPELMDAYPDAKIILHPIRSVDSWHHFVRQDTVRRRESTGCTASCNMSAAVTGLVHSLPCRRRIQAVPLFNDDFRKRNGKKRAVLAHCVRNPKACAGDGGDGCWYSDSVTDGARCASFWTLEVPPSSVSEGEWGK